MDRSVATENISGQTGFLYSSLPEAQFKPLSPMSVKQLASLALDGPKFFRIAAKYKRWTMIPRSAYVDNLWLAQRVRQIPGTIVECGTWRGGMIAGMADLLGNSRRYLLFDSFQGLPPARGIDGEAAVKWQADTSGPTYYDNCAASEEEARQAMSRSPATDYQIVKGWFEATLPDVHPNEKIALLRLDADWYDSTKCILDNLADRVVPGGVIIVDDYYAWEGCAIAVNEQAAARKWRLRQSRLTGVCFIQLPR